MSVEIHWKDLDPPPDTCATYDAMLSLEEHRRAAAFHRPRDRWRYVVRRGHLRMLLARRLDCDPREVSIGYGAFGKPLLEKSKLCFSLSHSHGLALYTFSDGPEIGCDLEWRDPRLATLRTAHAFFSLREIRALEMLRSDQWVEGFFNCWTRKEAYVKALGLGLSLDLDSFDVSLAPGENAALLRGEAGCSIHALTSPPGWQAALAILDMPA